ncbi:hypothetical protein V7T21_17175 [Segatella copri]|jgi:hypothetical protein|uniref:hypothetical protein n=1 Tax=Segatella copri TaxID=165179 RepID=UPI002FF3FCA7
MDAKINIAKILKDKPEGTKLWTDMFGSVTLYVVTDACDAFQVKHHNKEPWFDKDGKLYKEGVLCIYPSKSMRDWEKFSWKKGDVLVSNDGKERVIFEKFQDNRYLRFFGKFFSQRKEDGDIDYKFALDAPTNNYTLEDKDVAQIYINTIEERLGGKLNRQTLEVEKALPEFKDGDIVFADFGNTQDIFIVSGKTNLSEGYYSFIVLNLNSTKALSLGYKTSFFKENLNTIRLATEEEKKQLFDALEKEGKAWDAEKKQIVDLKPNIELKPFDKVLVRDFSRDKWSISFFSFKKEDCYVCINHCSWNQCIPYIGNESLLGTTKDVEG